MRIIENRVQKIEYSIQMGAKKVRVDKGKGVGKHSKGISYLGVSGKGKGNNINNNMILTNNLKQMSEKNVALGRA